MQTRDLQWGFGWGLWGATAFSAYVIVLSLLRGSFVFADLGMTTWQIIGGYYLAGGAAGLILSLGRPLLRWRLGTYVLGYLVGFAVYGMVGWTMDGFSLSVWLPVILGLPAGGLALVLQDEDRGIKESRSNLVLYVAGFGVLFLIVLAVIYS